MKAKSTQPRGLGLEGGGGGGREGGTGCPEGVGGLKRRALMSCVCGLPDLSDPCEPGGIFSEAVDWL